jgi:hypothetical protein
MDGGPDWEAGAPREPQRPQGPQPMRLGMVLEVGVRILRRHWAVALVLAFLFMGAGALLTAATGTRFTEIALDVFPDIEEGVIETGVVLSEAQFSELTGSLAIYLVATIVAGLLASVGALALSALVAADYHARPVELSASVRAALRRTPSAIVFVLLTTLIIAGLAVGGLVLILLAMSMLPAGSGGGPGAFVALIVVVVVVLSVVYLTLRWAPAFPAMVNEDLGWRDAFKRSWHLSGDNVWRILFIVAFAAIVTALVGSMLAQLLALLLVGAVAPALGLDEMVVETISLALGSVLVAPLAPVLTAVLYFDLRARRDVPEPPSQTEDPYS